MLNIKSAIAVALVASAAGLALSAAVPAQAAPLVRLDAAAPAGGPNVQVDQVRWICGPYDACRWVPNYHRHWGWAWDDDDGPRWEGRRHYWRHGDDW